MKEVEEPFGAKQVGSSAMPYKRNPMKCERMNALSRWILTTAENGSWTHATQWLERTLDDSANRRLALAESFLAADALLVLWEAVATGLVVHPAVIRRRLAEELPFLATENVLMAAAKKGGDRQVLHERIRVYAQAAGDRLKAEGGENDLLDRIAADPAFRPDARGGRRRGRPAHLRRPRAGAGRGVPRGRGRPAPRRARRGALGRPPSR